jgi:hypothetical protein
MVLAQASAGAEPLPPLWRYNYAAAAAYSWLSPYAAVFSPAPSQEVLSWHSFLFSSLSMRFQTPGARAAERCEQQWPFASAQKA